VCSKREEVRWKGREGPQQRYRLPLYKEEGMAKLTVQINLAIAKHTN